MPLNEQIFKSYIDSRWPALLKTKVSWSRNSVYISTDFHIETENYIFLIEIDASNQAKLIAGQYLLINLLNASLSKTISKTFNKDNKTLRFIVIHFFRDYNPERSFKNMMLINNEIFHNQGIPFGSVHFTEFCTAVENFITINEFEIYFNGLLSQ